MWWTGVHRIKMFGDFHLCTMAQWRKALLWKPAGSAPAHMNKGCWNNSAHILVMLRFNFHIVFVDPETSNMWPGAKVCRLNVTRILWCLYFLRRPTVKEGLVRSAVGETQSFKLLSGMHRKGERKKKSKRGERSAAPSGREMIALDALRLRLRLHFSVVPVYTQETSSARWRPGQASAYAHTKDHGPFCASGFNSIHRSFSSVLFICVLVSISSVNRTITKARQSTDTHRCTLMHTPG